MKRRDFSTSEIFMASMDEDADLTIEHGWHQTLGASPNDGTTRLWKALQSPKKSADLARLMRDDRPMI